MRGNSLNVVIGLVMMSASVTGCSVSDDSVNESEHAAELGAITNNSAFTIVIRTETAPQDKVVVTSSDGGPPRDCFGCTLAYVAGTTLNLRIPFPIDSANCIHFTGWSESGACAGQGNPCTVVLNSDLVTEAIWSPTKGCTPR
jgi:hypothetical protein